MAPASLKHLIEEPFGPYPDHVILNSSWTPRGKSFLPQLRRLRIRQNNESIGLDTCENLVAPTNPSNPIFCFGVLVIQNLAWLSDTGKILLARELNKRDENWAGARSSQNSGKVAPSGRLTLQAVYGQQPARGSKISVWINFEKENAALFMTAVNHPESLLLSSKDQHRIYEIVSMERPTYSLSSNFLDRYRLVALIKEIVVKDNIDERVAEVENLVKAYLSIHRERAWSHAIIFAKNEVPVKPCLRHISNAEVRELFAAHSDWLLAHYLLSPKCPIDVERWCKFIANVCIAKKARESEYEDKIWISDDDASPSSIAKTLAEFGGTAEEWEKRLRTAIARPPQANPSYSNPDKPVASKLSGPALTYDPDFSEASTPGCSDPEDDSAPPQVFHPILLYMARPPALRPGRFIWDCPVPKCEFSLNLLDLKETVRDEGAPETVVRDKQFENFQDEQLQTFLYQRVSDHYTVDHLGINVKPYEDKQKFKTEFMKIRWQ
ncbi:hypothetical protein MSAN_01038200 [Mycena sanguinolenta]|uniref:Uncharacterized protein n=1 Tax=Mycena sanguinolenta TaxID=230812 RepID=A0A8H6YPI1_9AGAR|nr:hypothetical protein MSAN_01038200 [Mycena sanguinolenta]